MPSYNAPGVYIQDVVSGSQTISQASSSVGIMFGVTRSGLINVAQKIGSWTEFVEKYANGLDTPFLENSYLPYAVYGFFQNGGHDLYICNVKKNAQKATGTDAGLTVEALSEGVWGNDITVSIKKNGDTSFDVTVSVGTSDSATISEVTAADIVEKLNTHSQISKWITATKAEGALAANDIKCSGGTDGDNLTDTEYKNALSVIDTLDDVTLVAIPGQTSADINSALMGYCDANGLFPILDLPVSTSPDQAKATRKSMSAFTGCVVYPWGKVTDPLTNTVKAVPSAGHVMGVYARTIENRGVFKAPAGVEAVVRGFLEMETTLTNTNLNTLNPIGVVCIVARPNAGIVIWGARSLNTADSTMRYVSDGLLNLNIKKSLYSGTQFAVFEPNDETLWSRVETACRSFLENLRTQGALKGDADEAYYVTVNASNNTDATINEGFLNIEVGYAPVKPAEFVVIKLAHSIVSAE